VSVLARVGVLVVVLCGAVAVSASAQLPPTADYELVFDASWSSATHPQDFPSNPHFSSLIGGTHDAQVSFWGVGGTATLGIERMAELGDTLILEDEIQSAINAGHGDAVLQGGGIGTSPGSVGLAFTAQTAFSRLTLVSMLAPSPDWFVGVGSLNLVQQGRWVRKLVIPLHVYDAGTDSGTTYTSPNANTVPQDPIAQLDTGLFAPPGDVVGTFTLTRTDAPPQVPALSTALLPLLVVGFLACARLVSPPARSEV